MKIKNKPNVVIQEINSTEELLDIRGNAPLMEWLNEIKREHRRKWILKRVGLVLAGLALAWFFWWAAGVFWNGGGL